ncbi:MAG: diadenylate cyclase CdaA [Ruminococcus sp.]|nr:diadenylate cyclase CdaA [Ruminococcus sp.]
MDNFFSSIWAILSTFQFKDAIDILSISLILYYLFKLFRQSRAGQLVKGVVVLLIAYALSALFNLTMINYILKALFEFAVIIIVVVFQPELRQALERLGRNRTFKSLVPTGAQSPDDVVSKAISDVSDTCIVFSRSRTGALIVFERDSVLSEIAATGTELNSDTSVALLGNIFFNKAPLHDGACIIREGRILSAGCILPLTKSNDVNSELGTRHRAALGLSEESDAVIVVVSEETGTISIAVGGRLIRELDRASLHEKLSDLILPGENDRPDLFSSVFKGRKEKKHEKK